MSEQWALAIAEAERKFTEIAVADGNLVTYQREAMFALQAVTKSDYLQKCNHDSLRNAVINVASVGLSLSPALKLAYLVPRDGVACLDISYIGLVKIATDSGSVLAVKAEPVRKHDEFRYVDAFTMPIHRFDPFASESERGEIVGVYVVAKLANGITQIETLSREEIDKIRSKSKAKSGPWFDWFEEMTKKAAIKRASKMWPRSERLSKAEEILNEHQGNEGTLIEAESVVSIQKPKSKSKATAVASESSAPSQESAVPQAAATHAPQPEEPQAPPPSSPAPAGGASLSEGQQRILKARMESASVTEAQVCKQFKVAMFSALSASQFNDVSKWVRECAEAKS